MFGSYSGVNEYARINIETGVSAADPHKLILMLFDGAIAACQSAILYMQQGDITTKSTLLGKAINIIESGLRLSLDKRAGGEIAQNLDALYGYMSQRLYSANIGNEPAFIAEVVRLLGELRGAWASIAQPQYEAA